jgi:hypothetical protein
MRSSHYPICPSERAAARELNKRQIPLATGARWHGVTVAWLRQRS